MPQGVCYGRSDVALQPGWEAAMPSLAHRAAALSPVRVLCSPATRCLLPARALAELLGVPVLPCANLLELDFGDWEGRAWDEVPRDDLDRWAADPLGFAPPNGESGRALIRRVARFASRLRQEGEAVLVVSHGGPLRLLPALLRGATPDLMAVTQAMGSLERVVLP